MNSARICAAAIRERAVEAEKARRQPVETVQELTSSGLTRLLTPKRWGGYELDFATVVEAVHEPEKHTLNHDGRLRTKKITFPLQRSPYHGKPSQVPCEVA